MNVFKKWIDYSLKKEKSVLIAFVMTYFVMLYFNAKMIINTVYRIGKFGRRITYEIQTQIKEKNETKMSLLFQDLYFNVSFHISKTYCWLGIRGKRFIIFSNYAACQLILWLMALYSFA